MTSLADPIFGRGAYKGGFALRARPPSPQERPRDGFGRASVPIATGSRA